MTLEQKNKNKMSPTVTVSNSPSLSNLFSNMSPYNPLRFMFYKKSFLDYRL